MDILLDETTHDILFSNGTTPVTADVADGLKQRLKIKLLTFQGEWFLNTNYGTPYYQQILGKGRQKSTIDAIFRQLIVEDADVVEILSFNSAIDSSRVYSLSFSVKSRVGTTVEIQELQVGI